MSENTDLSNLLIQVSRQLDGIPDLQKTVNEIRDYVTSHEERIKHLEQDNGQLKDFRNGELKKETHTPETCPNKGLIRTLMWIVGAVNIPLVLGVAYMAFTVGSA